MLRVVLERSVPESQIVFDRLPELQYVGTLDQVKSVGNLLRADNAKTAILVVHPQQLPRALWLFKNLMPDIEFYPVNPDETYDEKSTQIRMHSAWRFRLWNMIAWSGLWQRGPLV